MPVSGPCNQHGWRNRLLTGGFFGNSAAAGKQRARRRVPTRGGRSLAQHNNNAAAPLNEQMPSGNLLGRNTLRLLLPTPFEPQLAPLFSLLLYL